MGLQKLMAGYLLNILVCLNYLFWQFRSVESQLNIYTIDGNLMTSTYKYECLYIHVEYAITTLNSNKPFCFQSQNLSTTEYDRNTCYGKKIRFQDMESMNMTVAQLFKWNAAIVTLDRYEQYLAKNLVTDQHSYYCKCSTIFEFGEYCQYRIDPIQNNEDGERLNRWISRKSLLLGVHTSDETRARLITCYVGISCSNVYPCLDWRQICNGIPDCDHGEDEPFELCSQLELNECDSENEFRCKNGMCIPIIVSDDPEYDCLDRSDRYIPRSVRHYPGDSSCFLFDDLLCDEFACPWQDYSCGDNRCISYVDAGSLNNDPEKTCFDRRNLLFLKQLFTSNETSRCWIAMVCMTGFSYLYSNIECLKNSSIENVLRYCPKQFYFPMNPVVYSFVFFMYDNIHDQNWLHYTGPTYICYLQEACAYKTPPYLTVFKNNLACIIINQTTFSWKNFYQYTIHVFRSCFPTFENLKPSINPLLYKCSLSNTSISIFRVKDKRNDCFFNEDEDSQIDLCLFDADDYFRCLKNQTQCIQQSLIRDNQDDCSDGSDEYFLPNHIICQGKACQRHFQNDVTIAHFYNFDQLCDNIVNYKLFPIQAAETDETDCEYWPYQCHNSPFTDCNRVWNCANGIDELDCSSTTSNPQIQRSFHCDKFEYYCIRFINDGQDISISCLTLNRIGDQIVDCIGAIDERFSSICRKKYPSDYRRRFLCMNSSLCITPEQVCNTIIDCPLADDERVCPWLYKSNSTTFHCKNFPSDPVVRCRWYLPVHVTCNLNEHLWFCDLEEKSLKSYQSLLTRLDPYPFINRPRQYLSWENDDPSAIQFPTQAKGLIGTAAIDLSSCKFGYPIHSKISPEKLICLCPPSHYGDDCQFQSERLTVIFNIQHLYYFHPQTVFRLVIFLLNEDQNSVYHDEITYNHMLGFEKRFSVYLSYKRMEDSSLYDRLNEKYVRVDSYSVSNQKVQYISSWLFPVPFSFLPVNQLSVTLNLENDSFRPLKCKKKCGKHGTCMYYLNSQRLEYCWCEHGWYGRKCQFNYSSDLCNDSTCATHSQCIILNYQRSLIKCICPLGRSGNRCYIKYNACTDVVCENGGTCLPLDQRFSQYICLCDGSHAGNNCEYPRRYLNIFIPSNTSSSNRLPAAAVVFTQPSDNSLKQRRVFFSNVRIPTVLKVYGNTNNGAVLFQIFYNFSSIAYYYIALQHRPFAIINTSIVQLNRCPNIITLFNKTVLEGYSYLKRLKLYHRPCNLNNDLKCFFDEYRMCFCTTDHNSLCYSFNHGQHNCNYCKNDGRCVQKDALENQWEYVCVCAPCSFGSLCQFSTKNYFINLDLLIGMEIKTDKASIREQPFVIILTLAILVSILFFGLISNAISFSILSNKKMQQVGCDVYLLHLTIVSQFGVTVLLLRYLYMLLIQVYRIENILLMKVACLLLEYSVRLIPPLFDWFIVCISIERAYMVIKNVHFTKLIASKSLQMTRWVIIFTYLFNIVTTLHRPFHLILVGEPVPRTDHLKHPWCILHFDSSVWNTYEKFINIFHLLAPSVVNIGSIISFLIYKIKFHLKTTSRSHRKNPWMVTKEQISKYKPILISTLIVIICETPRSILTFAYACTEHSLHRHIYLGVYLVSFLPLIAIVLIYILPSPKYRQYLVNIMKQIDFNRCRKRQSS